MSEPQKLHPISYITGIINAIKQNFIIIILFFLFGIRNFDFTNPYSYLSPGVFALIFLISFIANILRVYNTRYWLEERYFIVRSGVLNIKRKEIDIRRIQSIDTQQELAQRLVGGVKLQIKTPSDGVDLESVSRAQSEAIEQAIQHAQHRLDGDVTETEMSQEETHDEQVTQTDMPVHHLYHLTFKEVLFMAMTSGAIGATIFTVGPIILSVNQYIPWDKLFGEFSYLIQSAVTFGIILVLVFLVLCYIIGTGIEFVRHYGFTLSQTGHQLKIRYGLISVKSVTVPTNRVQAVEEKQSYLRKLFGYTSLSLIITSDMEDGDGEATPHGHVTCLPFIKRDKGYELLNQLVPSMRFGQVQPGMPWRSFHRYFWRESLILLAIAAIVHYFWQPYLYIAAGVIIALLIICSVLAIKNSGSRIIDDEISIRNARLFSMKQYYIKQDKLIGMTIKSNPFMQRSHLQTFKVTIAQAVTNQHIGLKFAERQTSQEVKDWYLGGGRDVTL